VNNSKLLALEKFHRRYLNLRPTDPAGGMLSTQPPRLNSAMHSMSLIKLLKYLSLSSELPCNGVS